MDEIIEGIVEKLNSVHKTLLYHLYRTNDLECTSKHSMNKKQFGELVEVPGIVIKHCTEELIISNLLKYRNKSKLEFTKLGMIVF